jgi:phage shock protein A
MQGYSITLSIVEKMEIEEDMGNQLKSKTRQYDELESQNDRLGRDMEKLRKRYDDERKELLKLEKENDQLRQSINSSGDQAKLVFEKLKTMEIDNENYERQLRYIFLHF